MASDSTSQAFQAFYLQQATAELAEDLDQLRTSADFVLPGQDSSAGGADGSTGTSGGKNGVTDTDNSLQLLIGALRQGTAMFSAEDQARVVGGSAASKGQDGNSESG